MRKTGTYEYKTLRHTQRLPSSHSSRQECSCGLFSFIACRRRDRLAAHDPFQSKYRSLMQEQRAAPSLPTFSPGGPFTGVPFMPPLHVLPCAASTPWEKQYRVAKKV